MFTYTGMFGTACGNRNASSIRPRHRNLSRASAYPAGIATARLVSTVNNAIQTLVASEASALPRGWNTRAQDGKFVPTFPNARYIFNQFEVEGSRANIANPAIGASFGDSIQPVLDAGIVDIIRGDREIDNGVRTR